MNTVRIQTRLGRVEGRARDGTQEFLGIRYAAPPVGARRFMPAEPVGGWSGTYDATRPSFRAMQPEPTNPDFYRPVEPSAISEDCLFLNVFTPAADDRRRPVMVWIHGGGLASGCAADIDGGRLATQGEVVVVAINYRLGYFGFLDLSRFGPEYAGSASNGFRDQIVALAWVRDNIADYGGDPKKVMIFGESGGGSSVRALLACPDADGLFHRAAALSPGGPETSPLDVVPLIAETLGVSDDDVLGALGASPAAELMALQVRLGFLGTGWIDGAVVTRPTPQAILEHGTGGVPILAGYTRDEGTVLVAGYENLLPGFEATLDSPVAQIAGRIVMKGRDPSAYLDALRVAHPELSQRELLVEVHTDVFRRKSMELAEAATAAGPGGWFYRFDIRSRMSGLRAGHAVDVPFVFNDFEHNPYPLAFQDASDPTIARLARMWSDALIAFAREGEPSAAGLPSWPRYAGDDRECLIFGPEPSVEVDPDPDPVRRKLWG